MNTFGFSSPQPWERKSGNLVEGGNGIDMPMPSIISFSITRIHRHSTGETGTNTPDFAKQSYEERRTESKTFQVGCRSAGMTSVFTYFHVSSLLASASPNSAYLFWGIVLNFPRNWKLFVRLF